MLYTPANFSFLFYCLQIARVNGSTQAYQQLVDSGANLKNVTAPDALRFPATVWRWAEKAFGG